MSPWASCAARYFAVSRTSTHSSHGLIGNEVVDEAFACLGDPVNAVLRLQVVIEAETAIEKDGVVRDGQRKAFLGGAGCRDEGPGWMSW